MSEGRIVRFGDFGSFFTTLQSEGAATEQEFNATLVSNVKVNFRPGKLFAQAMQGAELKRVAATPAPVARKK